MKEYVTCLISDVPEAISRPDQAAIRPLPAISWQMDSCSEVPLEIGQSPILMKTGQLAFLLCVDTHV